MADQAFDINVPTEPGLYESIHYSIQNYPRENMPYRLFEDGSLALMSPDGSVAVRMSPEIVDLYAPYRKFTPPAPTMALDEDFEEAVSYWLTFKDGSRIRAIASRDKYDDIDLSNDDFGFWLWVGSKGKPINRDHMTAIEKIEEN